MDSRPSPGVAPRRTGIYSGSFNPVHLGHVALCDHLVARGVVDEVWLVRSPLNPLKAGAAQTLAPDADRLAMLRLAIDGHPGLTTSEVEDDLPRPNYTIDTLMALSARHGDRSFSLIIGADNWLLFDRWRAWQTILRAYRVVVYPRPGYPMADLSSGPLASLDPAEAAALAARVTWVADAPQHDLAATEIRRRIARGETTDGWLDPAVRAYIDRHRLYGTDDL